MIDFINATAWWNTKTPVRFLSSLMLSKRDATQPIVKIDVTETVKSRVASIC